MDRFVYKKSAGITVLSASLTDFKYKRHSHKEYALGVTLRGIQEYNLEGSHQLSHENGVILFNPEQPHDGMAGDKTGLDYVMVYIEPDLFMELTNRKEPGKFRSPVVYNFSLQQKILNLCNSVLNKRDEAFSTELLLALADCFSKPDMLENYKKDDYITEKTKDMIHGNMESVLKLDDICRELDISKFQLIRMFKAATGITPYQYFLSIKLELAKEIIEKTGDIYSAVAEYGFTDLTHLNKHFKRIYGLTAFEYISNLN
ncbi:MAG: AraC family transcriptional regulator [Desulfobacteraceae bacterium]|nr:AraC family transcriptional regulator [Desulfobacteraceae bacterium]